MTLKGQVVVDAVHSLKGFFLEAVLQTAIPYPIPYVRNQLPILVEVTPCGFVKAE
jgi:hypothetical protein